MTPSLYPIGDDKQRGPLGRESSHLQAACVGGGRPGRARAQRYLRCVGELCGEQSG